MQDEVHSLAGLVKGVEVEQVGFVELDLVQYFSHIVALAGRKIVQSPDFLALRQQLPGQAGPDEARDAGNEVSCHGISIIQDRLRGISGPGTRE